MKDLDKAISNLLQSIELMPVGDLSRANTLKSLSSALKRRAKLANFDNNVTRAYKETVYKSSSPLVIRITAVYKALKLLGFSDLPRLS